MPEQNKNIIFCKIIGWLITEVKGNDALFVDSYPLEPDVDSDLHEVIDIDPDMRMKTSIIPAHNDYVVYGRMPDDDTVKKLGIHYGGDKTHNPNWNELYQDELNIFLETNKKETSHD